MQRSRRILMIGGVVAIAAATGHLMQSGGMFGPRAQPKTATLVPTPGSVVPLAATTTEPTRDLAVAPQPVATPQPAVSAAPDTGIPLASPVDQAVEASDSVVECPADIALIAQPGAMINLGLLAPCQANERVVIRHGGLAITGQTSASGSLIASIPAFASPAEVSILFADGSSAGGTVDLADLSSYDRFAVQWMDQDAFQLHAYEGPAAFGDPGHISAAAPRKGGASGSFLSLIGDATTERPLLAEVYTYPAEVSALSGKVGLTIEASVTEQTCDREILGETIQMVGGKVNVRDLSVTMGSCDTVGEFLLLDNPIQNEKLASN